MKYCFENAFLLYLNQIALTAQGFRPPQKCEAFNSAYLIPDRIAQDSDFLPELHRLHPQHNP
ncbi:hypothetical protein DPMN_142683 [Dreissena polymorpha]|uniref:Uncharacterized protein n=1 Tax=Dreissena polymorpha TaxID=45954 RepID=A0A9D4GET5_DREPO|nr:hypothetical protein DPMN_142125 [Dreissena polymorpha]KAH3813662.1 hypothetical protein DPMN_142127 [Dreissena polymorpha]KAH3814185.1 hypothetical protein DPMN_142679 [Dreissena polymorpha]KAH3814186.1 hypothetical protein DPMN_142680 [Dreissena polymorpha]KAH3814187.1 hypothetical protein DPMN_142681 [Dreissena polymorpha]